MLQRKPHILLYFTPASSSWLNAVEGGFAQLECRSLYCHVFFSVSDLNGEIERYIGVHTHEAAKSVEWTKGAKRIIATVE